MLLFWNRKSVSGAGTKSPMFFGVLLLEFIEVHPLVDHKMSWALVNVGTDCGSISYSWLVTMISG